MNFLENKNYLIQKKIAILGEKFNKFEKKLVVWKTKIWQQRILKNSMLSGKVAILKIKLAVFQGKKNWEFRQENSKNLREKKIIF